jgi:hypothetical protein
VTDRRVHRAHQRWTNLSRFRFLILLAEPNGGFKGQEHVVTAGLDLPNNVRDFFGVGQRLVHRLAKLLEQLLEVVVHLDFPWPWMPDPSIQTIGCKRETYGVFVPPKREYFVETEA